MNRSITFLVVLALTLFSFPAAAQGAGLEEFGNLGDKVLTFAKYVGGVASVIGFITAGIMFQSGSPQARQNATNVLIGTAFIMGATVLVNVVQGTF